MVQKSNYGKINAIDIGRGFVTAFAGAIIIGLYSVINAGSIPTDSATFTEIFRTGLAAGLGYLVTNVFTNSSGKIFQKEKNDSKK